MHIHESMVSAVGNDLKRTRFIFKRGIGTFYGAVNGNGELKSG
jgi:hypothetical protein